MHLIGSFIAYLRGLARDGLALWERVWFTPADPINVAVIRILTGCILLHTLLSTLPDFLDFYGPHAWIDAQAFAEYQRAPGTPPQWWQVQDPRLLWSLHALFLIAVVCFTLGLCARAASVAVWAGHLASMHRGVVIIYGMDTILAMLTFYLMFAPSGAALSLDRWRRPAQPSKSVAANVVLRLIQWHLCFIYLFSGLSKVAGAAWWNGTAVYGALMLQETTLFDMGWMASRDWLWMLLSHAGSLATVALELGFPVFVWHRRLRPLVLAGAITMQIGLGVLLSLGAFQAAMFAALCVFIPPHLLRQWCARTTDAGALRLKENRPG